MTTVDVVVPCYNYGRYLDRCVQSVLQQRDVDVRVLIVDDFSKDDTPDVGKRLAAADPRVTYHRNAVNLGLVGTANVGVMDWATSDYTLLLSADDAVSAGALSRAARVMNRHEEVGMTYGLALVVGDDTAVDDVDPGDAVDYVVMPGHDFLERSCLLWCGVASPTALVRTSVQHAVGGLDARFPHTCDMEIWMRISTRASIAALNCIQAYYRRHTSNMSTEMTETPLSDLRLQLATAEAVLLGYAANDPATPILLDSMRQRLSRQAFWMAGLALERGEEDGRRLCQEFAEEITPSPLRSSAWWRYRAKALLGRQGLATLRKALNARADSSVKQFDPFRVGELFGWWPEEMNRRQLAS